jgi:hypothetical protein
MVYEEPPNDLGKQADHFNPICRQFPKRENIIEIGFEHFYRLLKKDEEELPEDRIIRNGSIVRVWIGPSEDNCNVYTVDIDRGASLVAYETYVQGKLISKWTLEPQLVDGVWIPRRTTRLLDTTTVKREETIDWFENRVNEPIAEGEFSLVKMQLHRGDKIQDKRTDTMTTITGMEFPPPEKYDKEPSGGISSRSRDMLIGFLVLVIVVLGFVWRSRRLERKP